MQPLGRAPVEHQRVGQQPGTGDPCHAGTFAQILAREGQQLLCALTRIGQLHFERSQESSDVSKAAAQRRNRL
jgi:hypothetical protein